MPSSRSRALFYGSFRLEIDVLVFRAAGRLFAIRASEVLEVLRAASLIPLPDPPRAVEGVLNVRGRLVPVIAVPWLLDPAAPPMQPSDHLIVVQAGEHRPLALRVERALDLIRITTEPASSDNEPASSDNEPASSDHEPGGTEMGWIEMLAKTPRGLVPVLQVKRLLEEPEFQRLLNSLSTRTASQEAPP